MADILRIENADGSVSWHDFLTGSVGLFLIKDTWTTDYIGGRAIETMDLIAIGASADSLAGVVIDFEKVLETAKKYHTSRRETDSRWFAHYLDGENEKHSLIYDYVLRQTSKISRFNKQFRATYRLVLTRDIDYEEYETIDDNTSSIASFGGKWVQTSGDQNRGTSPGRIVQLEIDSNFSASLGYKKIWVGIKEDTPNTNNFVPRLELESSTLLSGGDASVVSEASAYNNSMVEITFATNTDMKFRTAYDIGSNWRDYVGQYLVLLRCKKSTTGSDMLVRLSTSWVAPSNSEEKAVDRKAEQEVPDSTAWQIIELGEIEIPPASIPYIIEDGLSFSTFHLNLEAERITGSGSLHVDALCLIPSNRYAIFGTNDAGVSDYMHRLVVTDKHETEAIWYSTVSNVVTDHVKPTTFNWAWPREGGVLVFAATQADEHSEGDTIVPSMKVLPRWKSRILHL